jgi:hypothetical protein
MEMRKKEISFTYLARHTKFCWMCLENLHKTPKTRMLKTSHHLKFLEAPENDAPHWWFKAKCLVFQKVQAHSWLFRLKCRMQAHSLFGLCTHPLHFAFNIFTPLVTKATLTTFSFES